MTLWRVRATVEDRPGFLSVLAASLALKSINILSVQVHVTEAGAVDDFLVDAPEAMEEADLLQAVIRGRGRDPWVGRAEVRGLVDEPTRVLALATRVAADPDILEEALADLLVGCEITWRAESSRGREGFTAHDMTLADPAGGTLLVHREAPAFTPAEYARAHAFAELSAVALARAPRQRPRGVPPSPRTEAVPPSG
jgi:hypothetical protein